MRPDPAGTTPRNGILRPSWARLSVALASALAVLAAAGCGASGAAGGAVSTPIRIALVPGVDDAPLLLALQDHMFTAAGLKNVKPLIEPNDSAVFAALRSHKAQIAATDYGELFYQQSLHADYKILADGFDATTGSLEILTLPGSGINSSGTNSSGINSPSDLADAKIAMPNDDVLPISPSSGIPDSLETAAATEVLEGFVGDNPSVKWVQVPPADEVKDLFDHTDGIQAILVGQPYVLQAQLKGAVEVIDACSGPTENLPLAGYVTTSSWAADHPTAAADFRAVIAKAQAEASTTGPVQAMLQHFFPKAEAHLETLGTYPAVTSVTALNRVVELMFNDDMITTRIPSQSMIAG